MVLGGAVFVLAACVGDDPSAGSGNDPDASPGASSGAPSGSSGAQADGSATCTAPNTCDGASLVRCDGVALGVCALGCANGACTSFDPTGPLGAEELSTFGLDDVVLDDNLVFDTDDGSVYVVDSSGALAPLRAANTTPTEYEASAGIGYRRAADRGIFFFDSFEVRHGTRRNFRGALGLTIMARRSVVVNGVWTLPCGALGALTSGDAPGKDAGFGGGGGGGHVTKGGDGRASCTPVYEGSSEAERCAEGGEGGPGGAPVPPTTDWALVGGGRGGNSGVTLGGGGGAAVQLVSQGLVTIGPGTADATAGINVGGCGGVSNGLGGGGAGGMLIVEAPVLNFLANAGIAANGGAGAPASPPAGEILASDGQLSKTAWATSPNAVGCSAQGGHGGADTVLPANAPANPDPSCGTAPYFSLPGGGGGGSVGRVHVVTRNAAPLTRDPGFFVVPEASIAALP